MAGLRCAEGRCSSAAVTASRAAPPSTRAADDHPAQRARVFLAGAGPLVWNFACSVGQIPDSQTHPVGLLFNAVVLVVVPSSFVFSATADGRRPTGAGITPSRPRIDFQTISLSPLGRSASIRSSRARPGARRRPVRLVEWDAPSALCSAGSLRREAAKAEWRRRRTGSSGQAEHEPIVRSTPEVV